MLITPPQHTKWDKLPKDSKRHDKTRKKIINYGHRYPTTEYTSVGIQIHESPDDKLYEYVEEENEYIRTSNKEKLKLNHNELLKKLFGRNSK